jgi:MFS family permease
MRSSSVFSNRNFLLLWSGQGLSVLGDQFAMIAMPWLVLQMTGDPLALGAVLALQGIPRALFMLVGGAVSDRISARTVMLVADLLRMAMFGLLAGLTFFGLVKLWMLYLLAFIFGLVSGFFNPASGSIVLHLVDEEQLRTANSFIQATAQLSTFLGPGIAGGLIAVLSGSSHAVDVSGIPGLEGIALAFVIDAASFLVSAVTLFLMRVPAGMGDGSGVGENMLSSIREGILYIWHSPFLRIAYLLLAAINLLCVGPLEVGIPFLANTVFREGVAAYGLIMAAYGGGNLSGILMAGLLPRSDPVTLKRLTVFLIVLFGVGLMGLSMVSSTALAFLIAMLMGMGNGYMALSYITLIQLQSPRMMIGRIISLLMLANLGLVPISQAIAGALFKVSLQGVFIGAGVMIILAGMWAASRKELLVERLASGT